jgi:hypothetical protein
MQEGQRKSKGQSRRRSRALPTDRPTQEWSGRAPSCVSHGLALAARAMLDHAIGRLDRAPAERVRRRESMKLE